MKTILVVDDELDVASVAAAVLNDDGYRVLVAANGVEAQQLLKGRTLDLLMCDMMMPLMDGTALIGQFRSDPGYQHVPILVMSALDESVVSEQVAGYQGFIRKPFRVARLREAVRSLMEPLPCRDA